MSELFAPMPLPNRPVQQTADIAEREAAARNREIDTRMRERLETGRLQLARELKVVERDYQQTLMEAKQDYADNLSQPSMTFNRSITNIAKTQYQQKQQENSRQLVAQEDGRLTGQLMSYDIDLYMQRNELMLKMVQEGMDRAQVFEEWQSFVKERGEVLFFTDDPYYASMTAKSSKAVNQATLSHTKWIAGNAYEEVGKRGLVTQNTNLMTGLSTLLTNFSRLQDTDTPDDPDPLGLGSNLEDVPSWNIFDTQVRHAERQLGHSYRDRGTQLYRMVSDALETRIANAAVIEASNSILMEAQSSLTISPTNDHIHMAMAKVLGSPLYLDVRAEFDVSRKDIRAIVGDNLGRVLELERQANIQARDDFNLRELQGRNHGLTPQTYYSSLRAMGVPEPLAMKASVDHGIKQEDQAWFNNQETKKLADTAMEHEQASLAMSIGQGYEHHPEYMGTQAEADSELNRLVSTGDLTPAQATRIRVQFDEGRRGLHAQYNPIRRQIDDYVNLLAADANMSTRFGTGLSAQFPAWLEGEGQGSLETLKEALYAELHQKIEDGEPDGESRLTPGVDGGMTEYFKRRFSSIASQMDLRKRTHRELTGLTDAPRGEAVTMEAFRIQPAPGVARATAAGLVDQYGDQAAIEAYHGMSPDRQREYAVKQIPLSGYTGQDDDSLHEDNLGLLRQAVVGGHIEAFELDATERHAFILLAKNGEWVYRDLDSSSAVRVGRDLTAGMRAAEDLEIEVEDTVAMGEGRLFYVNRDEQTGLTTPYSTVGAEAIVAAVQNVALTVVDISRMINQHGMSVLDSIDMSGGVR